MSLKNKHVTSPLIACCKDEVFFPNINLKIHIYFYRFCTPNHFFIRGNVKMSNYTLSTWNRNINSMSKSLYWLNIVH